MMPRRMCQRRLDFLMVPPSSWTETVDGRQVRSRVQATRNRLAPSYRSLARGRTAEWPAHVRRDEHTVCTSHTDFRHTLPGVQLLSLVRSCLGVKPVQSSCHLIETRSTFGHSVDHDVRWRRRAHTDRRPSPTPRSRWPPAVVRGRRLGRQRVLNSFPLHG
jgi:hypothetical protein